MNQENYIEQEVQRRLARQISQHHEEVAELQDVVRQCSDVITNLNAQLNQITAEPFYFGSVLKLQTEPSVAAYQEGDEVVVIDRESPYYCVGGRLLAWNSGSAIDGDPPKVLVSLNDPAQSVAEFTIGVGAPMQVRLTMKDDGAYVIINVDGKPWEVRGVPQVDLKIGDTVKIRAGNKQILSTGEEIVAGPICRVVGVTDDGIEIEEKGEKRLVANPKGYALEDGDRIVVDSSFFIVTKKLPRDEATQYTLTVEATATWDDIGGLGDARKQVQDAIELPFKRPDLFEHYGVKKCRGVLLFGPPGNGKTLIARVAAAEVARLHGAAEAVASGYLYIKSPEILNKYIGASEATIRETFRQGRKHYRQHGYPAVHVYDEADALMPQRGTRRSSDIADTIVPMFLGEMDGADEEETKCNPIIFLLSNRADVIDPAITRPGRISTHIKVNRPNVDTAKDILTIHARNTPFFKEEIREQMLIVVVQDIFSKSRVLYRVNGEHDFTFGDTTSGAMLAAIVEMAKMTALHRDMDANTKSGISLDDFRSAVEKTFQQQFGLNHSYDLADFAERHGLQAESIKVERCFGGSS